MRQILRDHQVDGFVLTGSLDVVIDNSGDDSLRGLTLSQNQAEF
ncbi:hypothetical protein Q31b_31830 [Novipirellula aureliae]|uniref:Uncharacterized protein n=1 Tax=Novipirellula aureliae TaxID=2527966 RepID=A0A5C6DSY6_9BACT|nr:hypothetical protein Q31b_31830 [Novipirellula aureliae]